MPGVPLITVLATLALGVAVMLHARAALRSLARAPAGDTAMARDARRRARLRWYVGLALVLHASLLGLTLVEWGADLHEMPLGIPGGSGLDAAAGRMSTNLDRVVQHERHRREQERLSRRVTRDSLLQILQKRPELEMASLDAARRMAVDTVGVPSGVGRGQTAAGSPSGTRIGAKLYLYRVRHNGDNWDANPKALPVLLREVKAAIGVEVASRQEVLTLDDLPRHRGKYMPCLLFMTGTGYMSATAAQRQNLRDYLTGGGFLVGDSSGGGFESSFVTLMREVLHDRPMRAIEFDHDVFRGAGMPYLLPRGCPVYREHGHSAARGIFDKDGRLMVFISPGDMGSAWASVDYGRRRASVELAFQMGTNLVTYALLTVKDHREK
jgi:hypothetical protein